MARPAANILLEHTDPHTYLNLQVLEATHIYVVLYKGKPINLRHSHQLLDGSRYKHPTFLNRAHASNLALKLNRKFHCNDFTVFELFPF